MGTLMHDAAAMMRERTHRRASAYRALFLLSAAPGQRPVDTAPWWAFWRKAKGGELAPAGRIVLADLERYCYAHRTSLKVSQVTQQSDALAMAFAEGRRDVLNRIKAMCNLDPDNILKVNHDE